MDKSSNKDSKFGKVQKPRKLFGFPTTPTSEHTPMEISDENGKPAAASAARVSHSPEKSVTQPKGHGQAPVTGTSGQTLKSAAVNSAKYPVTNPEATTSPKPGAAYHEPSTSKTVTGATKQSVNSSTGQGPSNGSKSSQPVQKATSTNAVKATSAVNSPPKRPSSTDNNGHSPVKASKLWTPKSKLNITPSPKKGASSTKNVQYTRKYHACSDISETFTNESPSKADFPTYGSTNNSRAGRPSYMSGTNKFKPVSIQDLLTMDSALQVETQMTFNVIYLQEFMPKHPKVMKNRRRMVLADRTGCINAFILKTEDVTFDEGDTVSIQEFKYNDRAIILHEGSVAIRIQQRDLPGHIIEQAQAFVNKPKMPVMAIAVALRRPHLTRVAVEGTIIKIERPRITTPKKDDVAKKVVRDIKVQDGSGIVHMSLWEGAAIYCEVSLGDHVIVSDASVSFNGLYNSKVMNVQFPDMVIFLPPIVTTEKMTVVGIDETGTESLFMFLLEEGSKFDRLTVPLEVLLAAFNLDTEPTVRDLLPCLPFDAKMRIKGLCVEACKILSIPESAVAKTDDSQISSNQFSDITDEQLLGAADDDDDATNPSDITLDNADENAADEELLKDDANP